MTLDELRAILIPFALELRQDFDVPTQRAYLRRLKDVPVPLLQGAVEAAGREAEMRFFPSAPEWLGRCERERQRLMALQPYEACSECHHVGTVRISPPGAFQIRYGRCRCWSRYLARMAPLGVTERPLMTLPAARVELEDEPESVTADGLPPAVSDQVRALAERSKW